MTRRIDEYTIKRPRCEECTNPLEIKATYSGINQCRDPMVEFSWRCYMCNEGNIDSVKTLIFFTPERT